MVLGSTTRAPRTLAARAAVPPEHPEALTPSSPVCPTRANAAASSGFRRWAHRSTYLSSADRAYICWTTSPSPLWPARDLGRPGQIEEHLGVVRRRQLAHGQARIHGALQASIARRVVLLVPPGTVAAASLARLHRRLQLLALQIAAQQLVPARQNELDLRPARAIACAEIKRQ